MNDLASAAGFAESSSWLVQAQPAVRPQRGGEARRPRGARRRREGPREAPGPHAGAARAGARDLAAVGAAVERDAPHRGAGGGRHGAADVARVRAPGPRQRDLLGQPRRLQLHQGQHPGIDGPPRRCGGDLALDGGDRRAGARHAADPQRGRRCTLIVLPPSRRSAATAARPRQRWHSGRSTTMWVSENAATGSWDALSRPIYRDIWPVAVAEGLGRSPCRARAGSRGLAAARPARAAATERASRARLLARHPARAAGPGGLRARRTTPAPTASWRDWPSSGKCWATRISATCVAECSTRTLARAGQGAPRRGHGGAGADRARARVPARTRRPQRRRSEPAPGARARHSARVRGGGRRRSGRGNWPEASALLDRLPAEMKRASYVAFWRERIDETRSRRR
ncbi:MAG: hypothetical protein MZW92_67515 [Comamonadaceae bacterium]|nr:hypothetical protein [Comamonadaceae bacterium]